MGTEVQLRRLQLQLKLLNEEIFRLQAQDPRDQEAILDLQHCAADTIRNIGDIQRAPIVDGIKALRAKLYLVAFKGYAYVMAGSEEEAIARGLQTAETNGCRPWACKATGCFPEFERKEPVDSDGRTCEEVLKAEGFKWGGR